MTDPVAPQLPDDAPQDVKDFFDCKADKLEWKKGKVGWLGLPLDPDVSFEHGAKAGTVNLTVSVLGVSFTLPASVNAAGELIVDTSSVPDLSGISDKLPSRQNIDDAIKNINAWFGKNGKKLKPAKYRGGVVTLEKTPIAAAPPAEVPGIKGEPVKTEPVKPVPAPSPPPADGELKKEGGAGCGLLGGMLLLLFVGVIALGGGLGFAFLGGPLETPTAALPTATISASPTAAAASPTPPPAPTATPTSTRMPSPTASPTAAATPTSTPAPTATSTAAESASAPATASASQTLLTLEQVCVRVVHQPFEQFLSYLEWAVFVFGAGEVDYFEVTVRGANNGNPQRLFFDPEFEAWEGLLGLTQAGPKEVVSLIAHMTDGSTIDMTSQLTTKLGGPEFEVRFPQEDTFGECL